MDNANSQEYLQKIKIQVIENLKRTTFAPSVQMTDVPRDPEGMNDEADAELDDLDEDENPDSRYTKRRWDSYVEKDGELSDSEDDEQNEANGVRRQPNGPKRRRNMMDYQNPIAVPDDKEDIRSGAGSGGSRERSPNGVDSHTASDAEGHDDESESEIFDGAHEDSLSSGNRDGEEEEDEDEEDEDIDMAEEPAPLTTDGPQEATPPDSPPAAVAANPTTVVPTHVVVEDPGTDAMDEGDTLDDPEFAKEEGRDEREREDVAGEKTAEVVERVEES